MAKKKTYRQMKAEVKKRMEVAQKIRFLQDVNSQVKNKEIEGVIKDLQKALNTKNANLNKALWRATDVNSVNLLNTINSELTIRDLENRIAYAKAQGETGPVDTNLTHYEISQYIKKFNDLYAAGLIRDTFSSYDYDSSRIGEFAKSVLSPEVIREVTEKAESYVTQTWKQKYGWNEKTIDF